MKAFHVFVAWLSHVVDWVLFFTFLVLSIYVMASAAITTWPLPVTLQRMGIAGGFYFLYETAKQTIFTRYLREIEELQNQKQAQAEDSRASE